MKKISFIISALLVCTAVNAQLIQASIGVGSTPNSIKIYLKPAAPLNGNISTLQYAVGIPAGTSPVPQLTIVTTSVLSGFAVEPDYVENGMRIYEIQTAVSGTVVMPAAETEAMELQFSGGPSTSTPVSLVSLSNYGNTTGSGIFFCSGAANSDDVAGLYYTRPGTLVANFASYGGGPASTATISAGIVLPVKFTGFTAVKQNTDGLLNWTMGNVDVAINHFEIERSFNGVDFVKIGNTPGNGATGTSSYAYTDVNIDALKVPFIYYRIKGIDNNGVPVYTEIRAIRLSTKQITMNLYPNPAVSFTNLSFELLNASTVQIVITDASGREMMNKETAGYQGLNRQRFDLSGFAAGKYLLTVRSGTATETIPFVKGN